MGLVGFSQGQTGGQVTDGMANGPDVATKTDPVVRFHLAAYGRTPTSPMLAFLRDYLRWGGSMQVVAKVLANNEFIAHYGDVDDAGFVALLYERLLLRENDPGWIARHRDDLETGRKTRADLLVTFAESGEYNAQTLPVVRTVSTYHSMLGRVPPATSLANWSARPSVDLATAILASPEYVRRVS